MPKLTITQIRQLSASGTMKKDISDLLGRPLNAAENRAYLESKPVRKVMSGSERIEKMRKKERTIELPAVEDPDRRKRLEKNTEKWLLHYMPNAFPSPFSDGHKELIKNVITAAKTGVGVVTAQPRGEGKTTCLRGCSMFLVVKKIVRFPVLVGWKHSDAKSGFKAWLNILCDSKEFAADYPEYCAPFIHSTHATALKNLCWGESGGEFAGEKIGASVDSEVKIITFPNSIGAIAARSAQGDAKGLNVILKDGTVLRPDFMIFDDAQDPKRAHKSEAVKETVDIIENVFMGMGGRRKRLVSAMACTIEAEHDVSCYFLNKRDWKSTIVSRVKVWPDGSSGGTWDSEKDCKTRRYWDDWRELLVDEGKEKAAEFFKANRKMMTGKMQTSWKHGFDPDKDVCDIDAAMSEWYKLGEDVFSRAQQNNPITRGVDVYTLTPEIVMSRVLERKPYELPEWTQFVIAATDINPAYALTSGVVAFGKDQSAAVTWYGKFEKAPLPISKNLSEAQYHIAVYEALVRHGREIAANPCKPKYWIIDAGGAQSKPVKKLAEVSLDLLGLNVIVSYGRAGKAFKQSLSKKTKSGEEWFEGRERREKWLIWNTDYWREVAQRSFTCETGSPGGTTIFKSHSHREFAEHICRKKLEAKGMIGSQMMWSWRVDPGKDDFADMLNMAFVGASYIGNIGTAGLEIKKPTRRIMTQAQLRR